VANVGNSGMAPLILNIGCSWRAVVKFKPLPLEPRGKKLR